MVDATDLDLGRKSRRLRVDTLVRLRWIALCGQAASVLITHFALGFPLPLGLCLLVVAASACLNIAVRWRFGRSDRLEDRPAAAILAYDIIQLAALLYLTGGLSNPFSMLFLAPVMIAAVSFSWRITFALTLLAIIAATALMFEHLPLPWYPGQQPQLPFIYTAGIWSAIVLGVAFTAIYASRVAEETRILADALAATELVIAREQHLNSARRPCGGSGT